MTLTLSSVALPGRGTYEYAERGQGEVTILMLHGYLDSWYSFYGMMLALPQNVRTLALSQRGHGKSPKPEDGYTIGDYAEDAIAFIEAMRLGPVILTGHSMGTFIAQEVALRRPDLVQRLILIATGLTGDSAALREFHADTLSFADPIPRSFAHDFQAGTCANPLGKGMDLERIVDETMEVPARVYDKALAGLIAYRPADISPEALTLNCPTLVIWGDRDEIFLRQTQDDLMAALQDAKFLEFPGIGHAVQWERPEECTEALAKFCALSAE